MVSTISTIAYGYEIQGNGKFKLFLKRNTDQWQLISPDWRREFQNAVNELVEIQPEGVDLLQIWERLDYKLPQTPWDWMED